MSSLTVRRVFLRARLAFGFMVLISALAARAADGDIDTGFGIGQPTGTSVLSLPSSSGFASAVDVSASGQIWMAASSQTTFPVRLVATVMRLRSTGLPDPSFNATGAFPGLIDLLPHGPAGDGIGAAAVDLMVSSASGSEIAYVLFQGSAIGRGTADPSVARVADGATQFEDVTERMPLETGAAPYVGLAKIAANGTLDTSFGAGGYVWVMSGAVTARALDIDRAGNILVLSNAKDLNSFHITRITANGFVDVTWSNAGTQTVLLPGVFMHALALDDQDRIVVAGMRANPNNAQDWDGLIYRALSNGAPDNGFGAAGLATIAPNLGGDNVDALNGLVIDRQGAIFVAGASRTGSAMAPTTCTVARVDADGHNAQFNVIDAGTQRECVAVTIANSNGDRVYAAGRTRLDAQAPQRGRLFAVRAGNLQADTSFGTGGIASTLAFNASFNFDVTDLSVDAAHRPVIVGGVSVAGESTYAARYVKANLMFGDSFE